MASWKRPCGLRGAFLVLRTFAELTEQPHTQMPHIPLFTQPTVATLTQTSAIPALDVTDGRTVNRWTVKGLASIEYIFEGDPVKPGEGEESETRKRLREVAEAEEWERRVRRQRTSVA